MAILDYSASKEEDLVTILERFLIQKVSNEDLNKMIIITKKNNKIKNWKSIQQDEIIRIYLIPNLVDRTHYFDYRNKKKDRGSLNVSLSPSITFINQKKSNIAEIDYNKTSFANLQLEYSYIKPGTSWGLYSNAMISSITPISPNTKSRTYSKESIKMPADYSAALFLTHSPYNENMRFQGGIEYEHFTTFNLQGVLNDEMIYKDENNVFFLSLGLFKRFNYRKESFSLAANLSHSFASSISGTSPYVTKSYSFSGYRSTLQLRYEMTDRWSLLSQLQYSSYNEFKSLKISLGISYTAF